MRATENISVSDLRQRLQRLPWHGDEAVENVRLLCERIKSGEWTAEEVEAQLEALGAERLAHAAKP